MDRVGIIGGSDIGSVFNIAPYGCARRLAYHMLGKTPEFDIENYHMSRGKRQEPVAADYFTQITGIKLHKVNIPLQHRDFPWLQGHIDRAYPKKSIAEIKCPSVAGLHTAEMKGLGEAYILQLQTYLMPEMHRGKAPQEGRFILFSPELDKLLHFQQQSVKTIQEETVRRCVEFYNKVQNGALPDRLDADDARCGKCEFGYQCQGKELYDREQEITKTVVFDMAIADAAQRYIHAAEIEKEADELKEAARREILDATTAERTQTVGAIITRSLVEPGPGWNTKEMEKDPELVTRYKTAVKKPYLRITVKKI